MTTELYSNLARTTLNGGIDNVQTTITPTSKALFLTPGGGAQFRIVIESEILIVTANSIGDWVVVRGAEGTTAASHADTTPIYGVLTIASLQAGMLRTITTAIGTGASQHSVTKMPAGSFVLSAMLVVQVAYDFGTTINLGITGTSNAFLTVNTPYKAGVYRIDQYTPVASLNALLATVGNSPSVGSAVMVVTYSSPVS